MLVKNKRIFKTTGELVKYLEKYPAHTQLSGGLEMAVEVKELHHEDADTLLYVEITEP